MKKGGESRFICIEKRRSERRKREGTLFLYIFIICTRFKETLGFIIITKKKKKKQTQNKESCI